MESLSTWPRIDQPQYILPIIHFRSARKLLYRCKIFTCKIIMHSSGKTHPHGDGRRRFSLHHITSPCASKLYYMCCFIDSEMASPRELFISTPAPVNMHNYSTAQSSIIIIINNIAAFGINFNSHACPKQNPRTFSKIYVNLHIRVKGLDCAMHGARWGLGR